MSDPPRPTLTGSESARQQDDRPARPRPKGLKPQTREVLRFLASGAPLTPKNARAFWGIDRLAARVHELRRARLRHPHQPRARLRRLPPGGDPMSDIPPRVTDDQLEASLRHWSLEQRHRSARARSAELRYYRTLAERRGWPADRISELIDLGLVDDLNAALRGAV